MTEPTDTSPLWLDQAAAIPGVLAGVIRRADRSILTKSGDDQFPAATLEKLVEDVAETVRSLQIHKILTARLRWTFEHTQMLCAARGDGALALLIVSRAIEMSPEVEQLLAGFGLAGPT